MATVIVRYAEMALKSKPVRQHFERLLLRNIAMALESIPHDIRKEWGRVFVDTKKPKTVCGILSHVPGIVSVSPALRVPADLGAIMEEAVKLAKKIIRAGDTFAVRTSREGTHPFTSREVNEKIGRKILSEIGGARVNLSSPDHRIFVEVRGKDAYIFTEMLTGVGGLPVGSQGSVLVVFSGSQKDIAATFLLLKRGCLTKLLFIFDTAATLKSKIPAARKLLRHHPRLELLAVPFNEIQKSAQKVPRRFGFYIHRRAILRIAELVAEKIRAEAIVLGNDVRFLGARGLVGLMVCDRVSKMPVLRPLLGAGMKNLALKVRESGVRRFGPGAAPSEKELKNIEEKLIPRDMLQRAVKRMKTVRLEVEE